jgi:Ca-activated chloride channel homolog
MNGSTEEEGPKLAANRSNKPGVIAFVVAAFLVMVLAVLGIQRSPTPTATGSHSTGKGVADPNCVDLVIAASSEKSAQLATLAGRFDDTHPVTGGRCVDVRVEDVSSGAAVDALATGWDKSAPGVRPDVWSPAATSWVGLLRTRMSEADARQLVPDTSPSLLQSPLVIGMPKAMALAMGWPDRPIGWSDIIAISRDPNGWARYGHPEWGQFKLGKTNPQRSTSGLNALVATYYAATGLKNDLSEPDLDQAATVAFVSDLERSVVHYGDTTNTFLANLLEAEANGAGLTYISAVPVEEKQLIAYNRGQISSPGVKPGHLPSNPLVAIYPADGTLVADHPYVTLKAPWVDAPKQDAARIFLAYLQRPEQQRLFLDAGFRDHAGNASSLMGPATGTTTAGPPIVDRPPSPAVLLHIERAWQQLRKPARILFVLDVSGSMYEADKIGLMKAATKRAIMLLGDSDQAGLWIFPNPDQQKAYKQLVPISPVANGRAALDQAVGGLNASGGTPLYTTVSAAVAALTAGADPKHINAVVVLTDGQNSDGNNDLDGLLKQLGDQARLETGVRVFTIAYGADADSETLARIARASRGAAYDASKPEAIDGVLTAVVSNF